MFLAIAVDNLADAESLSEIEAENERQKEVTRSIRRSSTMHADGRLFPVSFQ